VPQLTRIHKGSTGANGAQDKGLPVYTGSAQYGELQVKLDQATAISLGNPDTITVTIVTP
jgi:hypothetical protein